MGKSKEKRCLRCGAKSKKKALKKWNKKHGRKLSLSDVAQEIGFSDSSLLLGIMYGLLLNKGKDDG